MELYLQRNKRLENVFNQIHAFDILDEESYQPDMEIEEMPEQLMNDYNFQVAQKAMNIGRWK